MNEFPLIKAFDSRTKSKIQINESGLTAIKIILRVNNCVFGSKSYLCHQI
jgi:hypothetical protein